MGAQCPRPTTGIDRVRPSGSGETSPNIHPLGVLGGPLPPHQGSVSHQRGSRTSLQRQLGTPGFSVGNRELREASLLCQSYTASPWAQWDFPVTLQDVGLCGVGTSSFVVTGTCAQWALLAPMPRPTPARPGPSAGTIASPPCRSVRPAPQDWPALQVSEEAERLPPCLWDPSLGEEPAVLQGRKARKQRLLSPPRAWSTSP